MTPFSFFYDTLLHILALPALLRMLWQRWTKGKYKKNFAARFGIDFPKIEKKNRKLYWVHAVSVGEVHAVAPLVAKLKSNKTEILITCVTETGYEAAKQLIPQADHYAYLPFDLPYVICPIVRRVAPDVVLLVETDFWFHFQDSAKKAGAQLVLINGKISSKSLNRYRKLPYFAKKILGSFDCLCVQSALYGRRFQTLGISPQKIKITGNLKLEHLQQAEDTQKLFMFGKNVPVLTIGSTHEGEEALWVSILFDLWKEFPDLKVCLVPRHPERFERVANLLRKQGLSFKRWSEGEVFLESDSLYLMDTMGKLKECYRASSIAFVGGSFVPGIGGHNLIEPLQYAVPVLYGPYVSAQTQFDELIHTYGAGEKVTLNQAKHVVTKWLKHSQEREKIGQRGVKLIEDSKGALKKTIEELKKM